MVIAINSAYTRGFVFGRDVVNEDYARAVVERSCAAVATLLQEVFAIAEKTAFQQASEQMAISSQNRAFRRQTDIVRYRAVIEKSVVTAVVCAYVEMINDGKADADNAAEIERRISALEKLRCEKLDLMSLFNIDGIRANATDRNRPLLFDLNAKLSLLFGGDVKHIVCSPLSPATLIGGFVAGLMCVDMDVLSKKLLFRIFEQEFLSKLSVLMNSVILRLEQENLVSKRPVGFDEKNPGPISRVLSSAQDVTLPDLQQEVDALHKALAAHQHFSLGRDLYELSAEDSTESIMNLLSDLRYYSTHMQTDVLRMAANKAETETLVDIRHVITREINQAFSGKKMPAAIKSFLQTLWPNVLFDIYVESGESSDIWQQAIGLQHSLLESVTPVRDVEELTALNQIIPNVIRTLRRLLEETGCRYEDTVAFLGELKALHLQNVQQKLNVDDFVLWKKIATERAMPAAEPILNEDELVCFGQMRKVMTLLSHY